jgi:hypothetical protein
MNRRLFYFSSTKKEEEENKELVWIQVEGEGKKC